VLAVIHGGNPIVAETEVGGTCTCASTPKSGGEQGEYEVFERE